jgi:hypothetical protein
MLKARLGKEVVVRVANKIGELARLTKLLAERGANILAASAWVEGEEAVIRLVTDDTLRATDLLRDQDYHPEQRTVVLVDAPHKPGILRHLTDLLLRENIDLMHLFGSATIDQDICLVVLCSSDNERAVTLLNT